MSETKRMCVTMEDFIRAWEGSNSAEEVSQKLGIKTASIIARASTYRTKHGLPLKSMPHTGRTKFDADKASALLATLQN